MDIDDDLERLRTVDDMLKTYARLCALPEHSDDVSGMRASRVLMRRRLGEELRAAGVPERRIAEAVDAARRRWRAEWEAKLGEGP